ncbi:hypothetical protein QLQ86_08680 [Halomonas sp. LR5S13]|uniref:ATP-grasp domain-containing protein n=1 Tax=Halomonas rhizosphaerae TaxID=3043296 RepID=UPI0024A898E9|nr:hypothetical protein [Halomonas rhizosphaerae]MDI5920857.1 hypothetical protein [Halomonas rhizosphaerae]
MAIDWVEAGRTCLPQCLRHLVQRYVSMSLLKERYFARRDPLSSTLESDIDTMGLGIRLGIIKSRVQRHTHYVRACQELGLPFRVIDIAAHDWHRRVLDSGCELFFSWPDASLGPYARLQKDRCELIEKHMGKVLFPGVEEAWMYEDKIRTADWLVVQGIPCPRTWVFFDRDEARHFARECELPVVFKTRFGAASTGVRILRDRRALYRVVRCAFTRGHAPYGHDRRDREWGSLLLQEYLPNVQEWRMVRIGDSFFGHRKGRVGNFHSGSGIAEWNMPEVRHLNLLYQVTELAGFRSMDVDIFERPDGQLLVNELQTVFGASVSIDQQRRDGVPGRMVRCSNGEWRFEAGDFARNACANERIRYVLRSLSDERGRARSGQPGSGGIWRQPSGENVTTAARNPDSIWPSYRR